MPPRKPSRARKKGKIKTAVSKTAPEADVIEVETAAPPEESEEDDDEVAEETPAKPAAEEEETESSGQDSGGT
jgi:hypothetical protein